MAVQNTTMTEQERARLAQQTPGLARAATGLRDAAVGVIARPVTALQDAARVGATRLLGGDPTTLAGGADRYAGAAQQLTDRGVGDIRMGLSEVIDPIRQAGLGVLGAQPAPAQQPMVASVQTAAPTQSPVAAAPMGAQSAQAGMPPRSAQDLEAINQGLAYNVAATRAPAPRTAERGNYNMANTSTVDAQGNVTSNLRAPQSAGLDGLGSFGGESAGQYLQRMAAQDRQEQAQVSARRTEAREAVDRIGLRNAMTQGTPQERRAARLELEGLNQRAAQRVEQAGETQRVGMQGATELQRTGLAGALGLQQEAMRGEAGLAQADLTGQYGLAGQEAIAQSRILAEQVAQQSPTARLAAAREQQLQMQAELMRQAQAAGDVGGVFAAAGLSRPSTPEYIDPLTGAPLTPDLIEILQAQTRARLSPQR